MDGGGGGGDGDDDGAGTGFVDGYRTGSAIKSFQNPKRYNDS